MPDNLICSIQNNILKNKKITFSDYIQLCRSRIESRRLDLDLPDAAKIIGANTPFEFLPSSDKHSCGVLLVHGLFDSPFTLKDIGFELNNQQILCRSILLSGHGTRPEDLLNVHYQNWIDDVLYGIESLRKEVEKVFVIGYSTGAALAVYHALQNQPLDGLILLSPAIKIRHLIDITNNGINILKQISQSPWLIQTTESDYVKYSSIPFNAVHQVSALTKVNHQLNKKQELPLPVLMVLSYEDETISGKEAIRFFSHLPHPKNKMLLYTPKKLTSLDPRIHIRSSSYPHLNIKNFSHSSIPFSPDNSHYGIHGDYPYVSSPNKNHSYGAYHWMNKKTDKLLHHSGLIKKQRLALTYNPDFSYMTDEIVRFIKNF